MNFAFPMASNLFAGYTGSLSGKIVKCYQRRAALFAEFWTRSAMSFRLQSGH